MVSGNEAQVIRSFCKAAADFLEVAQTAGGKERDAGKVMVIAKRLQRMLRALETRQDFAPREGFAEHAALLQAGTARIEGLTRLLGSVDLVTEFPVMRFDDHAFGEQLRLKGGETAVKMLQVLVADPTGLGAQELALVMPQLGISLAGWKDILKWLIKMLAIVALCVLWWLEIITLDEYIQYVMMLGEFDKASDSSGPFGPFFDLPPPVPPPLPGPGPRPEPPFRGSIYGGIEFTGGVIRIRDVVLLQRRTSVVFHNGSRIAMHDLRISLTPDTAKLESVKVYQLDANGNRIQPPLGESGPDDDVNTVRYLFPRPIPHCNHLRVDLTFPDETFPGEIELTPSC